MSVTRLSVINSESSTLQINNESNNNIVIASGGGDTIIDNDLYINGIIQSNITIDITDTNAFLIRKNNNTGNVFSVDTVNSIVNSVVPIKIKVTDANAFIVNNVSDLNLFKVDTSSSIINITNSRLDLASTISESSNTIGKTLNIGSVYTDTSTLSGSTSSFAIMTKINAGTINATNTNVTTTNAVSFYIAGAPAAGTNQTITNGYSMWIGSGTSKFSGSVIVDSVIDSTSTITGSVILAGGIGISKKMYIGDTITSTSTTSSTSNSIGSLLLAGSIGISNTTDASSSINGGTITTAGGLAVAKKAYIGTNLSVNGSSFFDSYITIDSTSTSAFTVRKNGNSGDVFYVDTTGSIITTNSSKLLITGNISGTPSSVGSYLNTDSVTFTDNITSSSGTVAQMAFHSFETPTLAATNTSITTTNASTIYIEGAPINGTNQTITNSYSLYVNSGKSYFWDDIKLFGNLELNYGKFIKLNSSYINQNILRAAYGGTIGTLTLTGADAMYFYSPGNSGGSSSSPLFAYNSSVVTFVPSVLVQNTSVSTSNSTGSIRTPGGISSSNTTDATSSLNGGSMTLGGGLAVAKKAYIGSDLNVTGNLNVTGTITGVSTTGIPETNFSASNNITTPTNITGFLFNETTIRSFKATVSIKITATVSLYSTLNIRGLQKSTGNWIIEITDIGDTTHVIFSIVSVGGYGQIRYTSGNETGFVSSKITFSSSTHYI